MDKSEKEKAKSKHYRESEVGKANNKRYNQSEKGKATQERFRQSVKGKTYERSEKGKAIQRERHLWTKYGITEEQYQRMLNRQGGFCAVCGNSPKTRRLSVDHDHKTKRVRALVCHQCNRHKIGTNTAETARKVLSLLESDFDGRKI